ncbi:membrane-associated tyrosine- and threonine-specific cdc2-inhibitory kinase wee-1.1-like [Diabrotica undecimpunctata]|uniref:membrane-associated tyrosine- and threonine-specific cdc2-inhibitory kinase wee-1.1-like n=1 Tax=Diabrotica undecimpunctata TaxID=50387 RepID=UPI003B63CCED
MGDRSPKREEPSQKKNAPLPLVRQPNSRATSALKIKKAKPAYVSITVNLDSHYNSSLKESYYQQIYTEIKSVGEGGFGKVFKVIHKFTHRKYAIKKFKRITTSKEIYSEIRNNEKVGYHHNIVKYHMSWEEGNEAYMVLEACQMSLADYAEKNKVQENLIWDCLYDMCNALQYLHKRCLVHYDVKSNNIMIHQKCFKLGDFGTLYELSKPRQCTQSKLSDINISYSAVTIANQRLSPSVDVYDLGYTLSGLITGRVSSTLELLLKRMKFLIPTTRPSIEDILDSDAIKDVARRCERGLRKLYTTQNLEDIDVISTQSSEDCFNLPGCSKNP